MGSEIVPCPCCDVDVSGVEAIKDGQVSCPECGSWFPKRWAENLAAFEAERKRRQSSCKDSIT